MSGGAAGGRGLRRLVAVCALLLGLFLMHGAPATAAEGCHGAVPSVAAHTPDGHTASAMAPAETRATSQTQATAHSAPAFRAAASGGMSGERCLSTPAQERNPLPAPALLAAAAVLSAEWSSAARRAAIGRLRRRGPPTGGRDLLTLVCIART
ncbi:hypothetical protein ACFWMT_08920 [Streptomyces sp. NPDC058368]|uniref:hypothetical protein n=1 Tax=Streptomyces sp. NPDC058368 TaxID=3346461 RepID=UPI00364A1D32